MKEGVNILPRGQTSPLGASFVAESIEHEATKPLVGFTYTYVCAFMLAKMGPKTHLNYYYYMVLDDVIDIDLEGKWINNAQT
jgi:hypothetical protein